MKIFHLPDLGEGLPDAEIVEWHVKVGDNININDPLVSVETAKAIVDIPSPQSGLVSRLYGKVDEVVQTGDPLVEFDADDETDEPRADSGTVVGEVETTETLIQEETIALRQSPISVKATPAVRALAHRMKVDLSMVTPSGHDGLIIVDDIRRVARILAAVGPMQPLRGMRRAMARNMAQAHSEVVPATIVDDADITELGHSADITPRLIHALIAGCKAEPALNAWYDSHAVARRVMDQIHLGLAVDSPVGLFVAVLQDVHHKGGQALQQMLDELKQKIKNRTLRPADMRGYTITLSNYGSIAGRYAAPVVLPPTVAILGAGLARDEVVARDGKVVVRHMLPLSLTIDHRAVTGGEAARFLKAVIDDLESG